MLKFKYKRSKNLIYLLFSGDLFAFAQFIVHCRQLKEIYMGLYNLTQRSQQYLSNVEIIYQKELMHMLH